MKKTLLIALVLGLAGCVEPDDKKPAATGPSPAGAAPPGLKAGEAEGGALPACPAVDPRIRLAELTRREVASTEESLYDRLCKIRDAVKSLKAGDGDRRFATAAALKEALPQVEQTVEQALEDARKTADALAAYRREVFHAQNAYRSAAQAWRERARDFPEGSDQAGLNGEFAESFEATARRLPRLLAAIDDFSGKLPKLEAFLKDHRHFLGDFSLYLRAVLDQSGADPARTFLERRKKRHAAIDEYHGLLLLFLESMRGRAVSSRIQDEVRREQLAREEAARKARELEEAAAGRRREEFAKAETEERAREVKEARAREERLRAESEKQLAAARANRVPGWGGDPPAADDGQAPGRVLPQEAYGTPHFVTHLPALQPHGRGARDVPAGVHHLQAHVHPLPAAPGGRGARAPAVRVVSVRPARPPAASRPPRGRPGF